MWLLLNMCEAGEKGRVGAGRWEGGLNPSLPLPQISKNTDRFFVLFCIKQDLRRKIKSKHLSLSTARTHTHTHARSNDSSCPYGTAAAVEAGHLLRQFVQLQRSDPQNLDPEVVGVLVGGDIHLQMFIRLEAQVWTWN